MNGRILLADHTIASAPQLAAGRCRAFPKVEKFPCVQHDVHVDEDLMVNMGWQSLAAIAFICTNVVVCQKQLMMGIVLLHGVIIF